MVLIKMREMTIKIKVVNSQTRQLKKSLILTNLNLKDKVIVISLMKATTRWSIPRTINNLLGSLNPRKISMERAT